MKRIFMILMAAIIAVFFIVGVSAEQTALQTYGIRSRNNMIYYVYPASWCHTCQADQPYIIKYEPWTKKIHSVRHYCIECWNDQLAGFAAKPHRFVDGVCLYCGEE